MSKSALALADHGNSPALVSSDSEFGLFARALNGMAADVRCKSEALSEESSRRRNIESALIDTSVNPVITVTPNGFITTWNSGGRETVRLQRRRGDRPRYRAHYSDRSPGGASRDRRKGSRRRSRRRDRERPPGQGRTKNRRRAKRPIDRASLRQNRRALKITRDITAQKLTEEKFQLAVESCPSGMVLVDRFGDIVLVNSEIERLFGYRRDELLGQKIEILIPENWRQQHIALPRRICPSGADAPDGSQARFVWTPQGRYRDPGGGRSQPDPDPRRSADSQCRLSTSANASVQSA